MLTRPNVLLKVPEVVLVKGDGVLENHTKRGKVCTVGNGPISDVTNI
jgi:hypothetical protein